jgi:hypothetical protein
VIFSEVVTDTVTDFVTLYHRHLCTSYIILLIESLNVNATCEYKISRSRRHWKGAYWHHSFSHEDVTDKVTHFVTLYHHHLGSS